MKRVLTYLLVLILLTGDMYAQGRNNIWTTGYDSPSGIPWGGTNIDFKSGSPLITYQSRVISYNTTVANISDKNGNLLFSSNGQIIADVNGDTLVNGGGLNPSNYTLSQIWGLNISQANLIIPFPNDTNNYYLFHSTLDSIDPSIFQSTKYLYYSVVDMSANLGLGEVMLKNQILFNGTLNQGKLSAVKHGNGRDWWLIAHSGYGIDFYKFLITDIGIQGPFIQSIGVQRLPRPGEAEFNLKGSKFIFNDLSGELEIFDFDRCTGFLSNSVYIKNSFAKSVGASFSPNSRFIYASSTDSLFQFDLNAANIELSRTLIAVWDSFYSPIPPLATFFQYMKLAPDGKIYITTGNGTFHYHIIDQPDSLGTACNVIQHGLDINHYYFNTLPNHPNYHLGALTGSPCDTLLTGIPPPEERLTLKLYPNPNKGTFQITYTPTSENLKLLIYDVLGKQVYQQILPQWSQLQNINLTYLSSGVYFAKLSCSKSNASLKFVVE